MAKQGIFTIWLVDRGARSDHYWGEGTMYAVGSYLRDYFNQICQHPASPFASANFSWVSSPASVAKSELVVYFLANPNRSIIQNKFNQSIGHGGGATFMSPAGMISEVYLSDPEGDRDYPRLVANLAFHELLHNKLDAAPQSIVRDIHSLQGGLSKVPIKRDARPSLKEIELMAKALGSEIPQYTLGMS
ncbi:MAG: hypothetical protein M3209_12555 [Acidobacteriota bacterium]|nr:hypothetical protein [Acidobacteriota bacterium]